VWGVARAILVEERRILMAKQGETGDDERSEEAQGATSQGAQATENDRATSTRNDAVSTDAVQGEAVSDEDGGGKRSAIADREVAAGRYAQILLALVMRCRATMRYGLASAFESALRLKVSGEAIGESARGAIEIHLAEVERSMDVAGRFATPDVAVPGGASAIADALRWLLGKDGERSESVRLGLVEMRFVAALARDALLASSENFRDEVAVAIANVLGEPVAVDCEEIEGEVAMARLEEVRRMSAGRSSPAVGRIRGLDPREQGAGQAPSSADSTRESGSREPEASTGEVHHLADRLPELEWSAEAEIAGSNVYSSEYVDGWNDARAQALRIFEELDARRGWLADGESSTRESGSRDLEVRPARAGAGGWTWILSALVMRCNATRRHMLANALERALLAKLSGGMIVIAMAWRAEVEAYLGAVEGGEHGADIAVALDADALGGRTELAGALRWVLGWSSEAAAKVDGGDDSTRESGSRGANEDGELGPREQSAGVPARAQVTLGDQQESHRPDEGSTRESGSREKLPELGSSRESGSREFESFDARIKLNPREQSAGSSRLDFVDIGSARESGSRDEQNSASDSGLECSAIAILIGRCLDAGHRALADALSTALRGALLGRPLEAGAARDLVEHYLARREHGEWSAVGDQSGLVAALRWVLGDGAARESRSREATADEKLDSREQSAGEGTAGVGSLRDQADAMQRLRVADAMSSRLASADREKKSLPTLRVVHVEMHAPTDSAMRALHTLRRAFEAREQTPLSLAIGAGLAILRLRGQLALSTDALRELVAYADSCGATGGDVELGTAIDVLLEWLGVRGGGGDGSARESRSREATADGELDPREQDAGEVDSARASGARDRDTASVGADSARESGSRGALAGRAARGLDGQRSEERASDGCIRPRPMSPDEVAFARSHPSVHDELADAVIEDAQAGRLPPPMTVMQLALAAKSSPDLGVLSDFREVARDAVSALRSTGHVSLSGRLADSIGFLLGDDVDVSSTSESGSPGAVTTDVQGELDSREQSAGAQSVLDSARVSGTRNEMEFGFALGSRERAGTTVAGDNVGMARERSRQEFMARREVEDSTRESGSRVLEAVLEAPEVAPDVEISNLRRRFSDDYVELHREWTAAVGGPDYDKEHWRERERALFAHYHDEAVALGRDGHLIFEAVDSGQLDRREQGAVAMVACSDSARASRGVTMSTMSTPTVSSIRDALPILRTASAVVASTPLSRAIGAGLAVLSLRDSAMLTAQAERELTSYADSCGATHGDQRLGQSIDVLLEWIGVRDSSTRASRARENEEAKLDSREQIAGESLPTGSVTDSARASGARELGASWSRAGTGSLTPLDDRHLSLLNSYVDQWMSSVASPDLRLRALAIVCGLRHLRGGIAMDSEARAVLTSLASREFLSGAVGALLNSVDARFRLDSLNRYAENDARVLAESLLELQSTTPHDDSSRESGSRGRPSSSTGQNSGDDAGTTMAHSSELAAAIDAAERAARGDAADLDHRHRKLIDETITELDLRESRCRTSATEMRSEWLRLSRILSRVDTRLARREQGGAGQAAQPQPQPQSTSSYRSESPGRGAGIIDRVRVDFLGPENRDLLNCIAQSSPETPLSRAVSAALAVLHHGRQKLDLNTQCELALAVASPSEDGERVGRAVSALLATLDHLGAVESFSPAVRERAPVDFRSRLDRMEGRLLASQARAGSAADFLAELDRRVDLAPEGRGALRQLIESLSQCLEGDLSQPLESNDPVMTGGHMTDTERTTSTSDDLRPREQGAAEGAIDRATSSTSPRETGSREAGMLGQLSPREQSAGATGYSDLVIEARAILPLSTDTSGGFRLTSELPGMTDDQRAGRIPPGDQASLRATPQLARGYRYVRLAVSSESSSFRIDRARVGSQSICDCCEAYGFPARALTADESNRWVALDEPLTSAVEVEVVATNLGVSSCVFSAVLQLGEEAQESSRIITPRDVGVFVDGLPARALRDAGHRAPGTGLRLRGPGGLAHARRREFVPREQDAGILGINVATEELSRESGSRGCENVRVADTAPAPSARENGSRDLVKSEPVQQESPSQSARSDRGSSIDRSLLNALAHFCWRDPVVGAPRGAAIADALQALDGFPHAYPGHPVSGTRALLMSMAGMGAATKFEDAFTITELERTALGMLISATDAVTGAASASARENRSREQCCDSAGDAAAPDRGDFSFVMRQAFDGDVVGRAQPGAGVEMMLVPVCAQCGQRPAECLGLYEGGDPGEVASYACGSCCGHGNEDGRCRPLVEGDWRRTIRQSAG